jgi:type II secretory ATPase GspE/PulE/Tfp pilus assembly ATPase PilB-like protein
MQKEYVSQKIPKVRLVSLIGDSTAEQLGILFHIAALHGASDIHFDIKKNHGYISIRVAHALVYSTYIDTPPLKLLVGRLKLVSGMRTDIADKAQDGSGSMDIKDKHVYFRAATSPTVYGENIVCRLFASEDSGHIDISHLGIPFLDEELLKKNLEKESGLILVSGPTGSGKTTTLYACLNHLSDLGKMVISIEDPVEVVLPRIRQIKINKDIGYDFKDALKGVLRQDPDVIMVGEIRDKETAELAIQAALTGHLVLATIHAPSALEIIDRLKVLGISPSMSISIIQLLIAQKAVTIEGAKKIIFECIPLDNKLRSLFGYARPDHIADSVREAGVLLLRDHLKAYKDAGHITKEEFARYIRS